MFCIHVELELKNVPFLATRGQNLKKLFLEHSNITCLFFLRGGRRKASAEGLQDAHIALLEGVQDVRGSSNAEVGFGAATKCIAAICLAKAHEI